MPTPLPLITTLARSGALDRAWALYRESGYEAASDDPAALAVKGRLLKDSALRKQGGVDEAARARMLDDAATAYEAADALAPAPYLLINAAACRSLGGDSVRAKAEAGAVLSRIDDVGIAETPYWLSATKAEAYLINGDVKKAEAALGTAIALDPDGWEDHATTLRQFARLTKAAGKDAKWLNAYRPPASLHFAGHLGIASHECSALQSQVEAWLEAERVGFGYGALAAGSDIVIAESLIARGAELHVILPAATEDFVALSVAPYGAAWVARFEACLAAAQSVHVAASVGRDDFEPLATALAADLAMGAAILNATRLETSAKQLLIIDEGGGPYGGGAATARDGGIWSKSGRLQHVIVKPRSASVVASSQKQEGRKDRLLVALLRVDVAGLDDLGDEDFVRRYDAALVQLLAPVVGSLADQPFGNGRLLGFASPAEAATAAGALLSQARSLATPLRVSGHYALTLRKGNALLGPALTVLDDIAAMALDDALTVSENFATALQIAPEAAKRDAQYVGDCLLRSTGQDTRLFTIAA